MANYTHGMNVAEVKALGAQLQKMAGQIEGILSALNGKVNSTTWVGPDATKFKQQWWPQHMNSLKKVKDDLHGFGQSAINNANEQEQVANR
jgi:uncharacterized protein YukE